MVREVPSALSCCRVVVVVAVVVGMLQDIIWAVTVGVAVVLVGLDEAEEAVAWMYLQLALSLTLVLMLAVVGDRSPRGGDRRGRRPEVLVLVLPVLVINRRGWAPKTLHVASSVVGGGGGVWSPGRVVWLLVTGVAVRSVAPRLLVLLLLLDSLGCSCCPAVMAVLVLLLLPVVAVAALV